MRIVKFLNIFFSIILINVFLGCSSTSNWIYISEMDISKNSYISDFAEIHKIVKKKYSHIENKNLNMDSLYKAYTNEIENIRT